MALCNRKLHARNDDDDKYFCYSLWQTLSSLLLVSLSGNVLVLINIVTLRRARLVPGWLTVLRWVNHLIEEPGTQVNSARATTPWVGAMSTQQKVGVDRHVV